MPLPNIDMMRSSRKIFKTAKGPVWLKAYRLRQRGCNFERNYINSSEYRHSKIIIAGTMDAVQVENMLLGLYLILE